MSDIEQIAADAIDVGIRIHRELGPGLLESVYEIVLAGKLEQLGYRVERQKSVQVEFEGVQFVNAFRIDLLVEGRLIIEVKSVERLSGAHAKQLLTYLRLTKQPLGLLMNFAGETLKEGLRRVVNDYRPFAPSREQIGREPMMFDLTGMTALVTGASGGIGSAIAAALAGQGARVALSGTREGALKEVAGGLAGDPVILPCNLSDPAAVDALVPQAVEALGRLDILVNNAGVTRDNLAMRMKDEEWDEVIAVNLTAAFRLIRTATRPMMKQRFGRVISITSVVGATGNPGQANYAASKGGLAAMTKTLAQELASRSITVNCVAPGFIRSAMTEALDEKQQAAISARIPVGAMGEGTDIGAAVAYLASREAAYITGQTLHVNGGMAMV